MKKFRFWALALFTVVIALNGQTLGERFSSSAIDINPTLVPATDTVVFTSTFYLQEVTLTNKSGADVTCTILDRQSTPRELYSNTVSPGIYIFDFKGRKMPGGMSWSCTSSTAVVGYAQGIK